MAVIAGLQLILEQLPPSERAVGDVILHDPAACARMTIAELASKAQTSKTTVIRLCQRLNLKSYRDLRLNLAREALTIPPGQSYGITETDDPQSIIRKVQDKEINAIQTTLAGMDIPTLVQVAETLFQSRQVTLLASGGALVPALDAYHKLLRLGLNCHLPQDQREQKFRVALCQPGDVAWAFSFSGASKSIVEALKIARATGATIISLTNNSSSPIARMSDLSLYGAASYLSEFTGTMEFRVSQLCIIDSLFLLMIKLGLPRVHQPLKITEEIIDNDCFPLNNGGKRKKGK
ncbi:putative HTH-type transcriptional regulator YbbH [Neomoorella glycerini]|uniref:Putative HTH-type transcriptional regulator YbbH n=1 Tax=Neomoorella glycerini TaxID=55779 RepID=A0A6I5ZMG7_9FIRM|nr:MurR/RpiR family transcriptional regulator [Moorella glycerini]QGP90805.1 putative HTH-type transcriptional regulator YbbH [Moorella glycerini]